MAKIHDVARQRRDHLDRLLDTYKSHPIPLALVARLAGDEPIDAWAGLLQAGVPFDVCLGSEAERNEALQLFRGRPRLILDPLTFWIAGCFDVLNVLADTYGPLGLTSSAIDVLERCREERAHVARHEGGSMTATDRDGEVVFRSYSEEQVRASFEFADSILRFAKSDRAIIIQAIPDRDFSRAARQFVSRMDPSVADVIAAASGSGRVLLCEDRRLRWLAREASNIKGVWLQPALLIACESGHFTRKEYNRITESLAVAGHNFTSLDHEVLLQAAGSNNWCPSGEFSRVVKLLGSSTIELQSMLVLASAFLRELWRQPIAPLKREALIITLLDAMISGRREKAPYLLNVLMKSDQPPKTMRLEARLRLRRAYSNCIDKWARDNGIIWRNAA